MYFCSCDSEIDGKLEQKQTGANSSTYRRKAATNKSLRAAEFPLLLLYHVLL